MTEERKKLGFELLLSNFFSNLGRMIVTNLIFAVPLIVSAALAFVLYQYVLPITTVTLPLVLVFVSPFYPGVVVLSREFSQGNKPAGMLRLFLKAIKDSWLHSLICGLILYVAFLGCYFSISIYSAMARTHWVFYILLFVAVLICVFFLFLFYALFLMITSFDLKFKDALKNSALMTFGELKQNFFATIGTAAYLAVVLMPLIIILHLASVMPVEAVKILFFAYLFVAVLVLIPAPCAMIVSNYLYPNMRSVIAGEDVSEQNASAPAPDIRPRTEAVEDTALSAPSVGIEELKNGDGDEYIFYQGKMIKRKTLLAMLEQEEG